MAPCVPVRQQARHQDPETEAAKWNSTIFNFVIYTCALPTVTCQNCFFPTVTCEKKVFCINERDWTTVEKNYI